MAEKPSSVLEGWSKWQIAVAVGAPIALGLAGLWYIKRRRPGKPPKVEVKEPKTETKTETKPAEPQVSLFQSMFKLIESTICVLYFLLFTEIQCNCHCLCQN